MSDAARWDRVKEVFQAAVERPETEWVAFLSAECGEDAELRREVESLLASHREAGGFLSRPAALATDPVPPEAAHIDRYRLLGKLGQGGMGVVHRAVRDDDVFRKVVALKIVQGGASPEHLRRLAQERQILGRLQHPNIATILDGGATPDQRPYLVMEYVEGEPIDAYCERLALSTKQRLEMFRTVCAAVHYAHQNLVVHRDLKPANILVTPDGQPKLLDFGIAKLIAIGAEADEAPTITMTPVMTPEYASPEQVRGLPITTASDVYSLGVLLYELLTGQRPLAVRTDSLAEIVRVVCETEPVAPSAARRSADAETTRPRSSPRELEGDLDTIVLKALRKEPERRYTSVQEFSDDIRRHLEGRPVLARKDTVGYRVSKFVGRHRVGVAASILILASMVVGVAMTVRQARIAEVQRARAEKRFADVRRLANAFVFDIHDEIRDLPGATRARERLVTTAQQYLDSLSAEAHGDLSLQRELAAAYERLGSVQGGPLNANVGDINAGLQSYRKALAIRQDLAGRPNADGEARESVARLQQLIGTTVRGMGQLEEAERSFREAADHLRALVAAPVPHRDLRDRLGRVLSQLSEVQVRQRKDDDARRSIQESIASLDAFRRDHPEDAQARADLALAYYADSDALGRRGEAALALERAREARALQEELIRQDPLKAQYLRGVLFSMAGEGLHLQALGRHAEAIEVDRRRLALSEEMARRDPKDRYGQVAVVVSQNSLGTTLIAAGQGEAALPTLRAAREGAEAVLKADPALGFVRNELAVIDNNLATVLLGLKSPAAHVEGCRALADALEGYRRLQSEGLLTAESQDGLQVLKSLQPRCL